MAIVVQPAMEVAAKNKPPTKQGRVVVTGIGVQTPIGHDPDVFYNNLLQGVSDISQIEAFDYSQYPTIYHHDSPFYYFEPTDFNFDYKDFELQKIAGEIKTFLTDGWVAPKLSKRMDRFMLYMLTASKNALADSRLTDELMNELDKTRYGVLIGSAIGGMKELLAFLLDGLYEDLNQVKQKPYIKTKDSDGRHDDEVTEEFWSNC